MVTRGLASALCDGDIVHEAEWAGLAGGVSLHGAMFSAWISEERTLGRMNGQ